METEDLTRELEKIEAVLFKVEEYLTKTSEANAALHMSEKVLYTPLSSAVSVSLDSIHKLITKVAD